MQLGGSVLVKFSWTSESADVIKWLYFAHGAMSSFFTKLITFGTSTVHATEIGLYPDHGFSEFHLHHSRNKHV
jgi:hypothetical protein